MQKVFARDLFWSYRHKKNSFVLDVGDGEVGGSLWATKALCLSNISVRWSIDGQKYESTLYMELSGQSDMVDETLRCVCLRWRADVEVDQNLSRETGISEHGGLNIKVWSWM